MNFRMLQVEQTNPQTSEIRRHCPAIFGNKIPYLAAIGRLSVCSWTSKMTVAMMVMLMIMIILKNSMVIHRDVHILGSFHDCFHLCNFQKSIEIQTINFQANLECNTFVHLQSALRPPVHTLGLYMKRDGFNQCPNVPFIITWKSISSNRSNIEHALKSNHLRKHVMCIYIYISHNHIMFYIWCIIYM